MKLSILVCTIQKRSNMFCKLMDELMRQSEPVSEHVEILYNHSETMSIGAKRNELLQRANGVYTCFIDDDDWISEDYIAKIMDAVTSDPDCCSLLGQYSVNGRRSKRFYHSIQHDSYSETPALYLRPPNHLNVIKASIAKQFKFPEMNFGEDTDWAMQLQRKGVLKTEVTILGVIYYYRYISNK